MTTDLFSDDNFGSINLYDIKTEIANEKKWLIEEIVKPELPNIIDNVEKCLAMLQSNQIFKMAITNNNNSNLNNTIKTNVPSIRGIISRQNEYIIGFQTIVHFPEFNKGRPIVLKLDTNTIRYELPQLASIKSNLEQILHTLEDIEMINNPKEFTTNMNDTMKLLTKSINLLENPPRNLLFPDNLNLVNKKLFPADFSSLFETPHHEVSLELVLIKNELCIDFRNLMKVQRSPWCTIDPKSGLSFVDSIKDELKADRSKNLKDILSTKGIQVEEPSLFQNLLSSTFSTEKTTLIEAQRFLSRCITFNNKVVMESEKIVASTSDPTLISLSSKLHGLETTISNFYTNLNV